MHTDAYVTEFWKAVQYDPSTEYEAQFIVLGMLTQFVRQVVPVQ